eukprot:1023202-Heterocapsa_arctica.AAC.1
MGALRVRGDRRRARRGGAAGTLPASAPQQVGGHPQDLPGRCAQGATDRRHAQERGQRQS